MAEDGSSAEERLLLTHRKEKKELQAQIQALKRSIPKGDKKKKKEVTADIAKLESDLSERQEKELNALQDDVDKGDTTQDNGLSGQLNDLTLENSENTQPGRVSKAQKRRDKKAAKEKQREECGAEDAANLEFSSRRIEEKKIESVLASRGLKVKEISSDGHCLYNAVQHQLGLRGTEVTMQKIRERVADYMRSHIDDFLYFLSKADSDEPYTLDEYESYCRDIETTAAWGGQPEMSAMTSIFKIPIQVIQADSPAVNIGEQFQQDPLVLIYHRHAYGLGEHYNSVIAASTPSNQPESEGL
ncbi:deubiquitinase OTUD6B-like [Asterias rubens]|uniref:deubiquitinase OTUD6B-like n=1 Tax=Asterias rubens TaxID=7604 RepID=UPI001454F5CF|nr:deubiquitinase OTUD6B-like [Asterias rubens]